MPEGEGTYGEQVGRPTETVHKKIGSGFKMKGWSAFSKPKGKYHAGTEKSKYHADFGRDDSDPWLPWTSQEGGSDITKEEWNNMTKEEQRKYKENMGE